MIYLYKELGVPEEYRVLVYIFKLYIYIYIYILFEIYKISLTNIKLNVLELFYYSKISNFREFYK